MQRRRTLALALGIFIAAAVVFRLSRRIAGAWGIDDAGITYAAAFDFADYGSLGANVEGTPVESYSNPLVFFVVALLRVLGLFDPVATHVTIEMLLFAGMATLVWSLLREVTSDIAAGVATGVFVALQLLTPATWLWYGSGLENVWVSCGLVALLWICVRTLRGVPLAPGWGAVAFLVALTRPEAPAYVAAFYAALVVAKPAELPWRSHVPRIALALGVTLVLYAGFLMWRRIGYGEWFPNTYFAKIAGPPPLMHNLRTSVVHLILPYMRSGLLASAVLVLFAMPRTRRLACVCAILVAGSLALPITAGEDYAMGEHRFATPFLTMTHASYAVLVAACVAATIAAPRRWAAAAAALAILPGLVAYDRVRSQTPYLDPVSIARVAALQGAQRWEHQMRLGVPYAVTMIPDAGGSLLVGAMQMIDNAYLADYDLAHMGRYWGGGGSLLRQLDQYVHEERRPDLFDASTAIGVVDVSYVGTRYLEGPARLLARSDLVEVSAVESSAKLILAAEHVRVYLSPATVAVGVPRSLIRCEVIVEWDGSIDDVWLQGAIDSREEDAISLRPYRAAATGIERRALLLQAPDQTKAATATLRLRAGTRVLASGTFPIEVTTQLENTAAAILADLSPITAMHRLAWLREQSITRLGMERYQFLTRALERRDDRRDPRAGETLLAIRRNVRLAAFGELPRELRTAELAAIRRVVATCTPADRATVGQRVACLGRAIDELRRYGYLDVVARVPELARELEAARGRRPLWPAERYQWLVGLTFAFPTDIPLRRELIALRRIVEHYPPI